MKFLREQYGWIKESTDPQFLHNIWPSPVTTASEQFLANLCKQKLADLRLQAKINMRASNLGHRDWVASHFIEGKLYASCWQRDCDCVESTRFYEFDSINEYYESVRLSYEWAEGPVRWSVYENRHDWEMDKEGYRGPRDRVLEAFENGNIAPYAV